MISADAAMVADSFSTSHGETGYLKGGLMAHCETARNYWLAPAAGAA